MMLSTAFVFLLATTTDISAGHKLYRQHCAACHGSDANGTRYAPPLRSHFVATTDRDALFRFITNGDLRQGMPAWSRLPDQRRWQLIDYLKSLAPARPSPSSSKR